MEKLPPDRQVPLTAASIPHHWHWRTVPCLNHSASIVRLCWRARSTLVLAAKPDAMMAHDIPFPYRQAPLHPCFHLAPALSMTGQAPDFFYLSGLNEPDALMILRGQEAPTPALPPAHPHLDPLR